MYTISYAANGAVTVRGHEKFYDLPRGKMVKNRPFHLPNATVRSGGMCLVEFGQTAKEGESCGLLFGFTADSGECLTDPLHDYYCHPSSVVFGLCGTSLLCGSDQEVELKKISSFNPKRRVAMLFHRTAPLKARVRIFVTEDGTFGESPKPYRAEAAEFVLAADTAGDAYIPCGNIYDKASLAIFSVSMNHDIPPQFLAHV